MQGLQLSLHCPTPGVLGSASFALAFWCSVKCSQGNIVLFSMDDMPNPLPKPSHEGVCHTVLVAHAQKVLVGDGSGARICVVFSVGAWCERLIASVHQFLLYASTQNHLAGWTGHSSGTVSV